MLKSQPAYWTSCINMMLLKCNYTRCQKDVCLPMSLFTKWRQVDVKNNIIKTTCTTGSKLGPIMNMERGLWRLNILMCTVLINLLKTCSFQDIRIHIIVFNLSPTQQHRTTLTVAVHTWLLQFWGASSVNVVCEAFTWLPLSGTQPICSNWKLSSRHKGKRGQTWLDAEGDV